jgi:hypothetical protein
VTNNVTVSDHTTEELSPGEARIGAKWKQLGGGATLGNPVNREFASMWTFANGSCICYNAKLNQAFEIHGAIYAKWVERGGLQYGVPCTDETATPDGVGRFNHFNDNTASIYWTPESGAHTIYGAIRQRWSQIGWETSYLGYPVSDEVDFAEGGRANEFQHGGIYWWADTGAIDLRDVIVHYTGLHCFGETDWDQSSNSDEPYVVIAVSTPLSAATFRSQVYDDVDAGETRPDLLEIYRGRPYGINVGTVVMEHDDDDPDRYKGEINDALMAAHALGTRGLGVIPVVGPAIAAIAGPVLAKFMPVLGDAINGLLDLRDDTIGNSTVTLSGRQMVLLAARTANNDFNGIGWKFESGVISGEGASYVAYYGTIPA